MTLSTGRRSHRRGIRILLSAVLVVLIAVIVAALIPIPYYAITPGDALNVSPLISVPGHEAHPHKGSVLLTDVQLVPLRAVTWPFYKLNGNDEIDPQTALTGTLTASQYNQQGVVQMSLAREAATIVGLHALGYKARAVPDGVIVYAPEPNSPASAHLGLGDVITKIDSTPTPSVAALSGLFATLRPGDEATVQFRSPTSSALRVVKLALGGDYLTAPGAQLAVTCLPVGSTTKLHPYRVDGQTLACLGFIDQQSYTTEGTPFPVTIDSEGIIGPSAGLAFSLGLIEKLDREDLTAGQRIAATGTMSIDGSVGDVGGVAQKTVAVRDAGATVFFVPIPELSVARAHAGPHLKVFAVATLDQAIADLEHLGGHLEPAAAP